MMKRFGLALWVLLTPVPLLAEPAPPVPLALTHVTVIDTKGGPVTSDMTVVIEGSRITTVRSSSSTPLPSHARVIDGRGKYLIPGLWDMHAHPLLVGHVRRQFSLFLANGVTGVRDLGGLWKYFDPYIRARREGRAAGALPAAPRVFAAGRFIDGSPPYSKEWMISVKNAQEARDAVDLNKEHGADFIKVYTYLSRESYFAIADEAKKQGLTFVGHVPWTISAAEASEAGQKSLEHADGILLASSTEEPQIRAKLLAESLDSHSSELKAFGDYFIDGYYLPMQSYSQKKAAALFARFVKNGTWVCPTLVTQEAVFAADQRDAARHLSAVYETASTRAAWVKFAQDLSWTPEQAQQLREVYHRLLTLVGDLQRAGVGVLAGSDEGGAPDLLPGFSLHEELALMVASGLTPLQALQTSTLNPARFLGREQDLGTIEAGKLADLVVLDADPLVDIHNTTKIDAVFANGTYLSNSALKRLLTNVASEVRRSK